MSAGFQVDLGALVQASEGVNGVMSDLQNNKVSDIGGSAADFGDGDLAATVSDFCGRWEIGVENFDYFDTIPADSRPIASQLDAEGLDFRGADLSGLDLAQAELSGANLSGARMVGASLSRAWLIEAVLRGADLSRCNLRKAQGRACDAREAILCCADLERSEFERADLRRANLREARFGRALLTGADLRGADLRQCIFGEIGYSTGFTRARLADCAAEGAHGMVDGPIDVGTDSPQFLDGADLQRWFADHGAPLVEVRQPAQP
jgi:uncharacterized protein YjbI with pentapeptide repeats